MNIEKSPEPTKDDNANFPWDILTEESKQSEKVPDGEVLRNRLNDATNNFVKEENEGYVAIINNLSESGINFPPNENPVEVLAKNLTNNDKERLDAIIGYIDARFSADGSNSPDEHTAKQYRQLYLKSTDSRAKSLGGFLNYMDEGNYGVDFTSAFVSDGDNPNFPAEKYYLPEKQNELAEAYFKYFDNPSEESKIALEGKVKTYTEKMKNGIRSVCAGVGAAKIGNEQLPQIIDILGSSMSENYGSVHEAIMKYYDYKHNEYQSTRDNTPQSLPETPNPETLDEGIIQ